MLKARINIKPRLKNRLRVYLNLKSEKVIKIKNMILHEQANKEKYYEKYNVGIRFLFGCDICNQKDEIEMISLRVFYLESIFKNAKTLTFLKRWTCLKKHYCLKN